MATVDPEPSGPPRSAADAVAADQAAGIPALVRARWEQAEAQLFPPLVLQPELYQRAVLLLAGVLDRLRALGDDPDALVAAASDVADLVAAVADERRIALGGIDAGELGQAACAMRQREISAASALLRRRREITAARDAGESWTVLEESGDPRGDPFAPYTRLDVDVTSGRALLVTARPDADFRVSEHAVRVVRIDLATGELLDPEEPADEEVVTDADERESRARQLRG